MRRVRNDGRPEYAILDELPEDTALVLWQYYRYARDWLSTDGTARRLLFPTETAPWVMTKRDAARAVSPQLASTLTELDGLFRGPGRSEDVRRLASAAGAVSDWAFSVGAPITAALFATLAADAEPKNPGRGLIAGKYSREAGLHFRAEQYFLRAVRVARKQERWEEFIRGHLGLGILFMQTKQDRRARDHQTQAASKAMRVGFEWLAAEAQHDLFQFMTVRGHFEAAEKHARQALDWYPKNNPRVPFLVADAGFLLICLDQYEAAVGLLRRVLRVVRRPPANVLGTSMLVRALANGGHERQFKRTRRRLLTLLPASGVFEAAARWHLAEGERALRNWDGARFHASVALDLALRQNDIETAQFARETLARVEGRQLPPSQAPTLGQPVAQFIELLTLRLEAWKPTKRGRPRRNPPHGWKV